MDVLGVQNNILYTVRTHTIARCVIQLVGVHGERKKRDAFTYTDFASRLERGERMHREAVASFL